VDAILQGLRALHMRNAVHRDVTPGNILFSSTDEVKVADFGLARYLAHEETKLTSAGTVSRAFAISLAAPSRSSWRCVPSE
jgi:serine/threonine protein kinase